MFLMVMILFFFKSLNSKQLKNALSLLNWFVLKSQDRIQREISNVCLQKRVKNQHQGNKTKNFVNACNLYHVPTFVIFISSMFSPEELAVKFLKQKKLM